MAFIKLVPQQHNSFHKYTQWWIKETRLPCFSQPDSNVVVFTVRKADETDPPESWGSGMMNAFPSTKEKSGERNSIQPVTG